jgi:type II secretory pathway pseudopilin PulG
MPPRLPRCPEPFAREDGATLVELMVTVAILAVVMTGVAAGMNGALNLSRQDRNRIVAANLATQVMEEARSTAFTDLQPGAGSASNARQTTETVGGVAYSVSREIDWIGQDATSDLCTSAGQPTFLRARVTVAWPRMDGVAPVLSESVIGPPGGLYTPNSGHVGARVTDAEGEPVAGHAVTLIGPGGQRSLTTTESGCAFFPFLTEGAYQVSLNSSGYIDAVTRLQQPVQNVTVTVGSTAEAAFTYDRAANVTLTLRGAQGGTVPATLPINLYNDKVLPSGLLTVGGTGSTRSAQLFPYTGGYDGWAGSCSDADPGVNNRARIDSRAGVSSSAVVPLATVRVTVRDDRGRLLTGASVRATDACGGRLTLGNTNSQGLLAVALPRGTWTFELTGGDDDDGASVRRLLQLNQPAAYAVALQQEDDD